MEDFFDLADRIEEQEADLPTHEQREQLERFRRRARKARRDMGREDLMDVLEDRPILD